MLGEAELAIECQLMVEDGAVVVEERIDQIAGVIYLNLAEPDARLGIFSAIGRRRNDRDELIEFVEAVVDWHWRVINVGNSVGEFFFLRLSVLRLRAPTAFDDGRVVDEHGDRAVGLEQASLPVEV